MEMEKMCGYIDHQGTHIHHLLTEMYSMLNPPKPHPSVTSSIDL